MARAHLCLFAKAPRPGAVKTRLATELGAPAAAALARAFFFDAWATVSRARWAAPVAALAGRGAAALAREAGAPLWRQGSGGLGARLERVFRRALEREGAPFAIALG